MAPSAITEDYYKILEVSQSATSELTRKSYLRLSLTHHPDRNTGSNQAFQLISQAYETLSNKTKRQEYDLLYPKIIPSRPESQRTQTSQSFGSTPADAEASQDTAQIATLRRTVTERAAQLRTRVYAFETATFELHRNIRQVEKSIEALNSIKAADLAEQAWNNSWGRWLLSPLYKQAEESREEIERKDRARQERRVEKDLKERRLESLRSDLRREESLLDALKKESKAADLRDDQAIRAIETRISDRAARERVARAMAEWERRERMQRQHREQQERQAQEAWARLRKQQAEAEEAAEVARKQENERLRRAYAHSGFDHGGAHQTSPRLVAQSPRSYGMSTLH
ncbi:hypothetical protein LTR82_017855 [Friedmanniomyces endolithicus]|uniref:J domain-containing protein n=1 Tax=Friedmanniomyces endolithicus TaxID=329885 RepID=A0AAN6F640_9PEZI|nr:hypothetical protein LTR82_017855 [Friedmanniomyces endolithicus]